MACAISLLSRITVPVGQTLDTSGNWRMASSAEVLALPGSPTAIPITNLLFGYGTSAVLPPASYTTGTFSPGNWISSGGTPAGPFLWIDTDNVAAGVYYLAYVVGSTAPGSCQDISIFTLTVLDGVDAGVAPAAQSWCSDDTTAYNLFNIIDAATPGTSLTPPCATQTNPPNGQRPCGIFSGTAISGAKWDPVNFTFTPSLAGVTSGSQTFTVVYTTAVSNGGYDSSCLTGYCIDEISFSITVTAAGYAGENSGVTVCNSPA